MLCYTFFVLLRKLCEILDGEAIISVECIVYLYCLKASMSLFYPALGRNYTPLLQVPNTDFVEFLTVHSDDRGCSATHLNVSCNDGIWQLFLVDQKQLKKARL